MISSTANQFACFARLLIFGSLIGATLGIIRKITELLSIEVGFRLISSVFGGCTAGITFIAVVLSFPYAKKGLFYPLVFFVGILMGEYIVDTIVALFGNLCYNKKEKVRKKRDMR